LFGAACCGARGKGIDPLRPPAQLPNAIKFTAQGHVSIEAREIECDAATALLEISVADSGIGIAKDRLSIVRQLARLMGGEAGVDREPGMGSRSRAAMNSTSS
jgi:signal transduction histidine kinase